MTCKVYLSTPTRLPMRSLVTAKFEDEDTVCGFPVAPCSTAIQFCDRHSNRSFRQLRIADLVVGVADVPDVSVSETVAFPPGEHHIIMHC